jgi:hypothetical protein
MTRPTDTQHQGEIWQPEKIGIAVLEQRNGQSANSGPLRPLTKAIRTPSSFPHHRGRTAHSDQRSNKNTS